MNVRITNKNGTHIKVRDANNAAILAKLIPEGTIMELQEDWDYEVSSYYKVGYRTEKSSIYRGAMYVGYIAKKDAEIIKEE